MKIMKIFGVVMALHVFVLVVIFANPGCTSSRPAGPRPTPADSVVNQSAPLVVPAAAPSSSSLSSVAAVAFDPNAPAVPEGNSRSAPMRPGSQPVPTIRSQPAPEPAPTKTYVVANGDSLWKIAQSNNVSYQELASANGMKVDAKLQVGQKLIIPTKPGAPAAAMPAPAAAKGGTPGVATTKAGAPPAVSAPVQQAQKEKGGATAFEYTVQAGDSLGSIAQKFQVKASDLATENNLPNPNLIRAGMKIIIPGWQAPPGGTPSRSDSKSGAAKSGGSSAVDTIPTSPRPANDIPVIRIDDTPTTKR